MAKGSEGFAALTGCFNASLTTATTAHIDLGSGVVADKFKVWADTSCRLEYWLDDVSNTALPAAPSASTVASLAMTRLTANVVEPLEMPVAAKAAQSGRLAGGRYLHVRQASGGTVVLEGTFGRSVNPDGAF